MFEDLRQILVEELRIPEALISPSATTFEVGLDSLSVVMLSTAIRQRTGVRLEPLDLFGMERLEDIAQTMEENVR
ncbi:acyl carrier protein [Streptomyces beigongshangae]|uniref:acyl carrier protein n=1 Tax=Streptomyces beigongshangae TaxID=2841597 RepID=UPI001C846B59|nr:acyl carrier protein [Streptomyces sp. REN17]